MPGNEARGPHNPQDIGEVTDSAQTQPRITPSRTSDGELIGLTIGTAALADSHAVETPEIQSDARIFFINTRKKSPTEAIASEDESPFSIFDRRATPFRRKETGERYPDFKAQLMLENPDLPERVIERVASSSKQYAPIMIRRYRSISEQVIELSADKKNKDIPQNILIEAAFRHIKPENVLTFHEDSACWSEGKKGMQRNGFYVEGVPAIKQRHVNWCGYSSLAMVLQHNGYTELTPEKLFKHEFGNYDAILEYVDPSQGPSIDTLAIIAQELTPLTPRILGTKEYQALQAKNPTLATPQDVLKTFLRKKIPSIIRIPGHFVVVTGFDPKSQKYTYNDPRRGIERTTPARDFEFAWGANEYYPRDARYLMMVLTQPKKNV
jgi:hypothetical protein